MLKHLASGGMADVLLGRSDGIEGFERHVVLKRIRPELARDQRFIRMFLDEARVVATLHHQHIVQVYDIGESDGEYFIAMEYVHGEDVRKILSTASRQRTHVPLGYAIAIVSAAAAGLHYAHERRGADKQPLNIVHRDVSPSNILVGYDGSLKVVDFGIATASMRQETRSGTLKGKLSYMSPEQCKGMIVDRRSDVYSLGVVLYELATTTRMLKGDSDYLVMEQIVTGKITHPQVRRPDLPSGLAEIIMRALATDREKRYATADELRIALDQFAASTGLMASTSTIAAYMHQQFGQRPEPWLELGPQPSSALDEIPTSIEESIPSNSWTELPRMDSQARRTSSLPRQSAPIGVITGAAGPEVSARTVGPRHSTVVPLQTEPIPTDSRLSWESQPRPTVTRTFPIQKAVIAGSAVIIGFAIWFVSGLVRGPVPVAAPAVQPAAAVAPAAAPPPPPSPGITVSPITESAPSADAGAAAGTKDGEPGATRKSRVAAAATTRTTMRVSVEPAPAPSRPTTRITTETPAAPSAKPDRPTRVAVAATSTPSRGSEGGLIDADVHRQPIALPPLAPPPQTVTTPAPATPAAVPPVETPAPVVPQIVAPTALDANRIAGDKSIVPDELTMAAIGRSGHDTLVSTYKVCLTADGSISNVSQLRSTGFPDYDAKIVNTIRRDWRYRPFVINGRPTPVCTALRFIYSQK
jgi:serine/threonine protein kinase